MRAVIQRVKMSTVVSENRVLGHIGSGLLVFLAVHKDDKEEAIKKMADKILKLRIFEDKQGKMNRSVKDIKNGKVLVVSQFTLYGDCKKGNRPSFIESARPEKAVPFYEKFVDHLKSRIEVETGKFGAMMKVEIINDGPTTIIIDV